MDSTKVGYSFTYGGPDMTVYHTKYLREINTLIAPEGCFIVFPA